MRGPLFAPPDAQACDYDVDDGAPPRLFVAKRGACMFEEKASKAQRSGAGALLVVNSVPGPVTYTHLTLPTILLV